MSTAKEIELYQPSNGTEGMRFMSIFCDNCVKCPSIEANNHCGILTRTMIYDRTDKKYPRQWIYQNGKPVCTSFKDRDEHNAERRAKRKPESDKSTVDLFG
jgi:hypothetical protein